MTVLQRAAEKLPCNSKRRQQYVLILRFIRRIVQVNDRWGELSTGHGPLVSPGVTEAKKSFMNHRPSFLLPLSSSSDDMHVACPVIWQRSVSAATTPPAGNKLTRLMIYRLPGSSLNESSPYSCMQKIVRERHHFSAQGRGRPYTKTTPATHHSRMLHVPRNSAAKCQGVGRQRN